jgi:hypothetical protein
MCMCVHVFGKNQTVLVLNLSLRVEIFGVLESRPPYITLRVCLLRFVHVRYYPYNKSVLNHGHAVMSVDEL